MRTLCLLHLAAAAMLADTRDWTLLRGIYPGQVTHVHMMDGQMLSGGFISTSPTAIVIRLRNGDQSFAKDQIRKVSVRKGSKRWRNAGVGAAVGAAALGTYAAIVVDDNRGTVAAAAAIGYGMIGAGIGALFPGYDTLYRAPGK